MTTHLFQPTLGASLLARVVYPAGGGKEKKPPNPGAPQE